MSPPKDFPLNVFKNNATTYQKHFMKNSNKCKDLKQFDQFLENRHALHFGVRSSPNERFVWNWHLLRPIINLLHLDWILYITHGFVDQSNISVYGRSLYLTLIARRSNRYAGTRFLKRGANFEVCTEIYIYIGHFENFTRIIKKTLF